MHGGSWVALITPFDSQGHIDWKSLERLIEWHIASGTHGLVIAGTTGECATLSTQEQMHLVSRSIELVNGRLFVVAGTGSNSTQEALEHAREAKIAGAAACLTVVPYYNKPTQEGLYQHFMAQADAVDIPQILYNVPGRTITDLANKTILRLAQHENIIGLKDATGDLNRVYHLRQDLEDDKFLLYSGDDMTSLAYMQLGGDGCISVTANVKPQQMSAMCLAAQENDFKKAQAIDQTLRVFHEKLFIESSPAPTKWLLAQKSHIDTAQLRLPLVAPSEWAISCLTELLDQI